MSLHQSAPGEGRNAADRTRFFNRKVRRGEKLQGWIAGNPHWFLCHTHKRPTKPCLRAITQGQLVCRECGNKEDVMGYVPFYDSVNTKPLFVLVYEDDRARLDRLRLHQFVTIMRDDREDARIAVLALVGTAGPKYQSTYPERMEKCDLTRSLLYCWRIPELTDWYNATKPRSDNPVSLPEPTAEKPAPKGKAKQAPPPMTAAAHAAVEEEVARGGTWDEITARIKARMGGFASTNGKHPPPGAE